MNEIGRNDKCPCGSGKKYKKCCLPKVEEQNAWTNKLLNEDYEKWIVEDEKVGLANMASATANPPDPSPAFAKGSEGEKLFNEMIA